MPHANQNPLRLQIEKMGWRGLDESLWAKLADFRTVMIAPPLDTIPSPGGNAIYTLVEELAMSLPEPTLVLARWPEKGSPLRGKISERILYDTAPLKPGLFERRLPYRLKRYITGSGAPFYFGYARRAARLCSLLGVGKIVIEDIPIFAPEVKRYITTGQSLFLHQHNNAPKSVPHRFWPGVVNNLDGILFVARETWRETEKLHGKLPIPARVVYNGVDLARYDRRAWQARAVQLRESLGILQTEKVLLYVGRIVPHKGIAEAVEAFVSACVPDSHFVVVGDLEQCLFGDEVYTKRLQRMAQQSPERVHLVGSVGQSDVPPYYALADVVIVPSLGHEGLPKVITEALAMQVPCIVTRRGGALELIQDGLNGWVVPEPVTVESLAGTIRCAFGQLGQVKVPGSTREAMGMDRMIAEFAKFVNAPSVSIEVNSPANQP
jgi:glycosyltransferase involved in cell wall biosynthesis